MKRLNPVSAFLFAAIIFLTSCATGSGYYGQRPAERSPDMLSQEQAAPALPDKMAASGSLRPVKVGILLPLSGKHAQLGQSMLKAAQMALFDAGFEGFELIPRDTKASPMDAASAAHSAITDGAEIILGPVFAEDVAAVRPIAQQASLNVIAFTTDWKQAGGNTYTMGFLPFDQIDRVIKYAALHNARRIGVISPTSDYGQVAESAYQKTAARAGIQTTEIEHFSPQTREMADTLRRFSHFEQRQSASLPLPYDAVFMPVGGDKAKTIANMLSQLGLPPSQVRRLGTGLLDDPSLTHEPGLENALFAAPSPNARGSFERRFLQSYGYNAPRLSTLAYDATALVAVLARQGLESPANQPGFNKSALMNPNGFAGIDGIFRFRPDGTSERGLAVLEIRRGTIAVVEEAPKTFQQPPATQ